MNLHDLAAYFEPHELEFKPITVSKKTGKGLPAAYVTNRAVMERLDRVCGPENWRNEFRPGPGGGVVCGLSIRVVREDGTSEWITKWDGAENTDIEAIKGGLSNAMRRAAVQWSIGRYLYDVELQWQEVDEYGRFKVQPRLPRQFLPPPSGGDGAQAGGGGHPAASQPETPARALYRTHAEPMGLTPATFKFLLDEAKVQHRDEAVALGVVRDELEWRLRTGRETVAEARAAWLAEAQAALADGPAEGLFGPDDARHRDEG